MLTSNIFRVRSTGDLARGSIEFQSLTVKSLMPALLNQAFRPHRRLCRRTRGDPRQVFAKPWVSGKVKTDAIAPPPYGEHIRIGHGEAVTHQVRLVRQLGFHVAKTSGEQFMTALLYFGRGGFVEKRAEGLVDFGTDVSQPCLEAITLHRARRWSQAGSRIPVGDVLQDCGALGQDAAVIQPESRHVAFGIDLCEILAAGRRFRRSAMP